MKFKNFVCAATVCLALTASASAEISPNALGLRTGGGSLLGSEINYQKSAGAQNRLELGVSYNSGSQQALGVSWRTHYIGAVGIYQWLWNISGGFNWYAGVGGGAGFWSYNYKDSWGTRVSDSDMYINLGGQFGIEYNFNVSNAPFILSLDSRPMINVLNDLDLGWDIALGIRFTF